MADLLNQIFTKMPDADMSVRQIQSLFKALDGQLLNLVLTRSSRTPEFQIPLGNNQSQSIGSIKLPITEPELSKLVEKLPPEVLLKVIAKFEKNRVAFLLNTQSGKANASIESASSNFQTSLKPILQWLADPKPIIQFQKSTQPVLFFTELKADTSSRTDKLVSEKVTKVIPNPTSGSEKSIDKAVTQSTGDLLRRLIINQLPQTNNKTSRPLDEQIKLQTSITKLDALQPHKPVINSNNPILSNDRLQSMQPTVGNPGERQQPESAVSPKRPTLPPQLISQLEALLKPHFENQAGISKGLNALLSRYSELSQLLGSQPKALSHIKTALESIPEGKKLTVELLRQAINHSGVFRERNIAQQLSSFSTTPLTASPTALSSDIKSLFNSVQYLLGVNAQATETDSGAKARLSDFFKLFSINRSSEQTRRVNSSNNRVQLSDGLRSLLQEVEQSASRTRVTQFQNLIPSESNQWVFEIPLLLNRQFTSTQIKFEQQDDKNNASQKRRWRVTIRFEFESLGAFHAIAELNNNQLDVRFVAEKNETRELLNQNMDELEQQLVDAGILLKKADAVNGTSPDLIPQKAPNSLIDYTI